MVDTTDPDPAVIQPKSNGRALTLKDLAILLTMMVVVWGAISYVQDLMYFDRGAGETLKSDYEHHEKVARPKLDKVDKLDKAIYRIEVRQRMMAPKRLRKEMPSVPNPESDGP